MNRRFRGPALASALGVLLAGVSGSVLAAPDTFGRTIAAKGTAAGAVACLTCHGAKGEGNGAAGFPRLAGLAPAYLAAQLDNFAAGTRQNPVMAPIAKALAPAERQAVAAYYGTLDAAPRQEPVAPETLKRAANGAWLALRGRWDDNLPACAQCHGADGAGIGTAFPALAGQSSTYILSQLHAFKDGTRPAGPLGLMQAVAGKLADADMTAVADYFGRAPGAPAAAGTAKETK